MTVMEIPGRGKITLPDGLDRTGDGTPLRFAVTLNPEDPENRTEESGHSLESVIGALLNLLDIAETEGTRLDDVAACPGIAVSAYVDES